LTLKEREQWSRDLRLDVKFVEGLGEGSEMRMETLGRAEPTTDFLGCRITAVLISTH